MDESVAWTIPEPVVRAAQDEVMPGTIAETQKIVDEMMQACGSDEDTLSCAIETIAAFPEELEICKPEILLITQDGCDHCEGHRDMLKTQIESGQIRELNIDHSNEAVNIMVRNGLMMTPSLLIVNCEGKLIHEIFSDAGDEKQRT